MYTSIEWDNDEKTIVRATFVGNCSMEEYDQLMMQKRSMLNEVAHPVDHIIDVSQTGMLPPGIMARISRELEHLHPNERHSVLVGLKLNRIGMLMMKTAMRLSPHHRHPLGVVDTLEEARHLLAEHQQLPS